MTTLTTVPTAIRMAELAVKLSTQTGYELLFSIGGDEAYFRHASSEHHHLGGRPYLVFSICQRWDQFYASVGKHHGFFSGEDLRDIEAYLRSL